jgi:hypothetical protein
MVVGLQNREIFLTKMAIPRLATVKGEKEREIRVIRVEQIQGAQVEDVVARNRREKSVQEVIFFFVELGVMDAENFIEVGARPVYFSHVEVVNHDSQ